MHVQAIQKLQPRSHTIVEAHPDVLAKVRTTATLLISLQMPLFLECKSEYNCR